MASPWLSRVLGQGPVALTQDAKDQTGGKGKCQEHFHKSLSLFLKGLFDVDHFKSLS